MFDFNVPSMTCDTLRGSSIESLDEIKNLNSTLYSEIYFQTLSGYDNDDPVLECPATLARSSPERQTKPCKAQIKPKSILVQIKPKNKHSNFYQNTQN